MKSISSTENQRTTPIKILIIEDNTLYRKSLVDLIKNEQVMECSGEFSSCEDALKYLQNGAHPDVVLLDIGLPGMDGVEGVKRIKSISPDVQIIMITVYEDNGHVFDAICAGAAGYLLKASKEEFIVTAINDVIKGGSPMNASIARKVVDAFAQANVINTEYGLSIREKEILDLIINGLVNKQIAEKLFLSAHTIDTHLRSIYNKMHVHTRAEAAVKAVREHLI